MTVQKLEELLQRSENEKLDFKQEFSLEKESNKKEFVRDVTAIANSKGGRGYIIFGIKDKTKEVVGVTTKTYDEERVQQMISSRCEPPVAVRLEEVIYQNKKVVVLTIFKSEQQPHQIIQNGTFYVRRGSTTDVARRHEIANMLQENGLICYETSLLRHSLIEDLNQKLVKKYITKKLKSNTELFYYHLEGLGIIGRESEHSPYHPTIGGMLLFGNSPQNFLPSTGIRLEYHSKTTILNGNIPQLLEQCEHLLSELFLNSSYPVGAVYEALYNAIVHRDYWDNTREIHILIHPKKIEIINPGAIWLTEGVVKFDNEIVAPRRNAWLYQRLLMLDKKQRFSNNPFGIRTIQNSFPNENNIVKFINLPKKNLFKVVLPGTEEFIPSN